MSQRRSLFINISVLVLLQNGILAALAWQLAPALSLVMTTVLAAGVIALSVATAMMATRIAGLHGPADCTPIAGPPPSTRSASAMKAIPTGIAVEPAAAAKTTTARNFPLVVGARNASPEEIRAKEARDALDQLDASLRRLASGDLATRCDTAFPQAYEGLRGDFNRAISSLDESIAAITLSAGDLHGECGEARLRLMQERSATAGDLPSLSAAANGMKDVSDILQNQHAALAEVKAMAHTARIKRREESEAIDALSSAAANLIGTEARLSEAASRMRDAAFRANLLSVSISVAAANDAPAETLKSFASELRTVAEDGANAARDASLVERDLAHAIIDVRSSVERMAGAERSLDPILDAVEVKLAAISDITSGSSDMAARTGAIIAAAAGSASQRKALDRTLEAILERMSQELAIIHQHCGRFIPVTLLRENAGPPDGPAPRPRNHLRLVKG